jgi:hypothetical protein
MKNLLFITAICFVLTSCEKRSDPAPAPKQQYLIGEWRIYPVGNVADSFFYHLQSNIDSLNLWIGGRVTGEPIIIPTISNGLYTISYRDTFPSDWHTHKTRLANFETANFVDSIPATVF